VLIALAVIGALLILLIACVWKSTEIAPWE